MPDPGKKPAIFLLLTFLSSWTLAFGYYAMGGQPYTTGWFIMAISYMFTPMLSAVIVQKGVYGQAIMAPLGVSLRVNRWWIIGWVVPALLAVASTGVSLLLPGVRFSADPELSNIFDSFGRALTEERIADLKEQLITLPFHPFYLSILGGLVAGATVNAVAGFGEELGWRGLLQAEWARYGFWRCSWAVGLVWGLWHAPFILHGYNYPGHPVAGVCMMMLWTVLFCPLIALVRLRSGSVIAAAIMHGSVNGTAAAPALVLLGGDSLTVGAFGVAGVLVLAVLNAWVYWLGGKSRRTLWEDALAANSTLHRDLCSPPDQSRPLG